MLLVKRNPDLMPTLFNELLNWDNWNNCSTEVQGTMPKMNVSESNENYEIELCVPGLAKEDLNLSIDSDDNMVIEMVESEKKDEEKKDEEKKESRHFLRHEFGQLQFKQLLRMPENVKRDGISATVTNGILSIVLPKFTEEEKRAMGKSIEIK